MASKKRGQNEGTITQRKDGRWEARISLGYDGGKLRRKCVYGKTRKEAQEKLTALLAATQRGLPVSKSERTTVEAFLNEWLSTVVEPSKRPKTALSYRQVAERHIIPDLGRIPLTKLTAQDVQRWLNRKAQQTEIRKRVVREPAQKGKKAVTRQIDVEVQLSSRTVLYMREILRNALNQAVRWDLVPRNVATLVKSGPVQRKNLEVLTPEQAKELLAAAKGHRLEALFSVALAIGLRIGEATGLRWRDIDLREGTITVNHQLQRIKGELTLTQPKTSKGVRTVILPRFATEALQAHHVRQQIIDRPYAGEEWQETGFVFTSERGTPLDDANVRRTLRQLLKTANLPHMRFHDLRHTCASLLLAQKVPPRVVMEILGHSQISLTLNTYSHVIPQLEHEAAGLMDNLLRTEKAPI